MIEKILTVVALLLSLVQDAVDVLKEARKKRIEEKAQREVQNASKDVVGAFNEHFSSRVSESENSSSKSGKSS